MKIERTEEFLMAGVQNQKKMTVKDENIGFMLSNFYRYSDPIGSMIREILSNAVDSMDEAKNIKNNVYSDAELIENKAYTEENLPYIKEYFANWTPSDIEVKFISNAEGSLVITDYGVGLSPERVDLIYGHMFSSTKRSDNRERGAFGLGAKSPLAYSDYYEVETCFNKHIYRYLIRKTLTEPELELVYSAPSVNETHYTSVIVPVQKAHEYQIINKIKQAISLQEGVRSNVCGKPNIYKRKSFSYSSLFKEIPLREVTINIANVIYPLSTNHIVHLFNDITSHPSYVHSFLRQSNISLNFDIGELDILWHRENIEYTDKTKISIFNKIQEAINELSQELEDISVTPLVERIKKFIKTSKKRTSGTFIFDGGCVIEFPYNKSAYTECPIFRGKSKTLLFNDFKYLDIANLNLFHFLNSYAISDFVIPRYLSDNKANTLKKIKSDSLNSSKTAAYTSVRYIDEESKEFLKKSIHRQVYVWKSPNRSVCLVQVTNKLNKEIFAASVKLLILLYRLHSEFGFRSYYREKTVQFTVQDLYTLNNLTEGEKKEVENIYTEIDTILEMYPNVTSVAKRVSNLKSKVSNSRDRSITLLDDIATIPLEYKRIDILNYKWYDSINDILESATDIYGIIDEINLFTDAYSEYTYAEEDYVSEDYITQEDVSRFKELEYNLMTKKEVVSTKSELKVTANFFWANSNGSIEYLSNNHNKVFNESHKDKLVIYGYSTDITYLYAVFHLFRYTFFDLLQRNQIEIMRITKAMEGDIVKFFPNAVYVSQFLAHVKQQSKKTIKTSKESRLLIRAATIHTITNYYAANGLSDYVIRRLGADEKLKKFTPSLHKAIANLIKYQRQSRTPVDVNFVKTVNRDLLDSLISTFANYQIVDPFIESELHTLDRYIKEFPALFSLYGNVSDDDIILDYLESKLARYNAESLIHFRRLRHKKLEKEIETKIKQKLNNELKSRIIPAIRKKAIADFTKSLQPK